jgi:hypothetical protein
MNPVYDLPSYFFNIRYDIIHLHTPRSSKWPFSFCFPPSSLNVPCATFPAHLIFHDLITLIIFGEEDKSQSFSLSSFLHNVVNFIPLRPCTLLSNAHCPCFSLNVRYQVSHLCETPAKL